ncbi:MAG: thiamine phosphate synthase [Clostridiales bacterium]|nr:thiamine phosphate synthase [Clostridiales bacterium]
MNKDRLFLYAITDRSCLKGGISLTEAVEQAILGGATIVQLREKNMPFAELSALARDVGAVCKKYGVPLIINDSVKVCLAADADGVHLGQGDMSAREARELLGADKIIGVTAKTVRQALDAAAAGADYIGSGAVFSTQTKPDAKSMDIKTLKSITAASPIPAVAIGGINGGNVQKLRGSGISGAAVVSGIFAAPDIKAAAADLYAKLKEIIR